MTSPRRLSAACAPTRPTAAPAIRAQVIVTFGPPGPPGARVVFAGCWGNSFPLCLKCWHDTRQLAQAQQPGVVIHVGFPPADIAAIGPGVTVRRPNDLGAVSEWPTGPRDRPLLIDAKMTASGGSWWLEEAFRGH